MMATLQQRFSHVSEDDYDDVMDAIVEIEGLRLIRRWAISYSQLLINNIYYSQTSIYPRYQMLHCLQTAIMHTW